MSKIPTSEVVRRSEGDVVKVNTHEIDGSVHTVHNMSRARRGRVPIRSAPRDQGESFEFRGRIG